MKPPSKPNFRKQVSLKLAMGDVKGAVNLVTSKKLILLPFEETKLKLQTKHPPRNKLGQSIELPDPNSTLDYFRVTKNDFYSWRLKALQIFLFWLKLFKIIRIQILALFMRGKCLTDVRFVTKKFFLNNDSNLNIASTHEGKKPSNCHSCDKIFSTAWLLAC